MNKKKEYYEQEFVMRYETVATKEIMIPDGGTIDHIANVIGIALKNINATVDNAFLVSVSTKQGEELWRHPQTASGTMFCETVIAKVRVVAHVERNINSAFMMLYLQNVDSNEVQSIMHAALPDWEIERVRLLSTDYRKKDAVACVQRAV